MKEILLTRNTIKDINQLKGWGNILIVAGVVVRIMWDFFCAAIDPEIGLSGAWRKFRKRIFAVIIFLVVDSIVLYYQGFYQ